MAPLVPSATAQPSVTTQTPSVVLEASVGERTSESGAIMAPLFSALEGYGFTVRPSSIARLLKGRLPRPGILDVGKTTEDIIQQINVGIDAFNRGRFKEAEDALTLAILQVKRNPALLVLDATNHKATFDAFVQLALSQAKLGHAAESVETMSELIRMSSTPVSRTAYGPQAEQFYRSVLKQVQSTGRGSLAINVNDAHAVIFLDGEYRGIGKVLLGDLIPGPHHAFVQVPGTASRQYELDIRADAQSVLDIDWRIDTTLTVAEPWAGFVFASELDRAREAAYAASLVRRWGNLNLVVVGMIRLGGTPCVIGTVYHPDGEAPRGAFVPLSDGARGLRSLARFLYDGTVSDNLSVVSRPGSTARPTQADAPGRLLVTISEIAMGTGAVAVATGGIVYARSMDDDSALTHPGKRAVAVGTIATGSALLGAGVYVWVRETRSADVLPSAALGAGIASVVAGGVVYLMSDTSAADQRYYTNTRTPGLIIGGSGLALTGIGLWLLHRNAEAATRHSASAKVRKRVAVSALPTLSIGASQALVGWAGSF